MDRVKHVAAIVAALPEARRRGARWCDVFCDRGAFSPQEARRLLAAASDAGLGLRLHADRLGPYGGARLAAETGRASADHLDHVDEAGAAPAAARTVAVLLPAATPSTRGEPGTVRGCSAQQCVALALGTDRNPGTSCCESMPYVVQLACLGLGLSVEELLTAATLHAARALRRPDVEVVPGIVELNWRSPS